MSTNQSGAVPARYATLAPRTQRALTERMNITPHGLGIYRVKSQSGAMYIVDVPAKIDDTTDRNSATCICPDYERSTQGDDCKHIRCVKLSIAFSELPEPEEKPTETGRTDHKPTLSESIPRPEAVSVATDGGAVENSDDSKSGQNPSTESSSSPEIINRRAESVPQADIYRRIAKRIYEIETEVNRHRAELRDLETALSVFEEFQGV